MLRLPYAFLGVWVTLRAVGLPRTVVGSAWGALGLALAVGSGRLPRGPLSGGYEAGLGARGSEGVRLLLRGVRGGRRWGVRLLGSSLLPWGPSSGGYEAGLGAHVSEGARLCWGGMLLGV